MKLALLTPVASDRLEGLKVTVPDDVLERVTLLGASVVLGLPKASCRCTVIVPEAAPAVKVAAAVVNASLLTGAALTLMLAEVADDTPDALKVRVTVAALVT